VRTPALLVLGLIAFAAAGCGGGGGDKRLSHAELVKQGNAICVAASGEIDTLGDPASLADLARIGKRLADIRDGETTKLAALAVATEDEHARTRLVSALQAWDRALRAVVVAARENDQAGATKALAAGQALGARASAAAIGMGLLRCAGSG
jgi:hypothetical protein